MELPTFLLRDPDGFIRIDGHRIGLHHVVRFYNEGYSPEMLLEQFPTLTLPLIHKLVAFYLENEAELTALFAESEAELARQQTQAIKGPDVTELRRRFAAAHRAEAL